MANHEIVQEIKIGGKPKKLVVTGPASARLSDQDIYTALTLHNVGDWGEDYECFHDLYQTVLKEDVNFLSAFRDSNYQEFWVISKCDGSITVMLPIEYDPEWKDPRTLG